ncbi:MAG: membrane protein insertion efficiency factor YidD [Hyphomicrobium sp.]
MDLLKRLLKAPIVVYQWTLRPLAGHHCRHWPTCSDYALDAIEMNGAWRGFWLMASRLKRCGPGGTSGVDPAPDIRAERHPFAPWRYGRWRSADAEAAADR